MNAFVDEARRLGLRDELSMFLHETLVESFRVKQVTMESDLYKAFGIVDDELDQVVMEVAKKAHLQLPTPAETAGLPAVRTVKDLLLFLSGLPTTVPSGTAS